MNVKALVEASLFVSDKPLSVERICKILNLGREEVEKALQALREEMDKEDRGIELVETPEGFELRVKQEYREKIVKFAPLSDLSDGMVRTLAIVVVKQPIKQSTIVKIQGNKAYDYIKKLEKKGLIKAEKAGRTKILTTTPEFERYFGKSVEEIKRFLEEEMKGRQA